MVKVHTLCNLIFCAYCWTRRLITPAVYFIVKEGHVKILTEIILQSTLCSLVEICGVKMQEEVHFEKYTPNFE